MTLEEIKDLKLKGWILVRIDRSGDIPTYYFRRKRHKG